MKNITKYWNKRYVLCRTHLTNSDNCDTILLLGNQTKIFRRIYGFKERIGDAEVYFC